MQNRTFLWLLYVRTFLLLLMSGTAGEVILSSTLFFFYESEANQLSDSVHGSCISTITTYNTIKILATQTISNYIWKANNCFQQPFCFLFMSQFMRAINFSPKSVPTDQIATRITRVGISPC